MYRDLTVAQLDELKKELTDKYNEYKSLNLKLDMSRGKPGKEQLDLSEKLLTAVSSNEECYDKNGVDCRNYGIIDGLPEAKEMFADLMNCEFDEVIVGGNSSLTMMYDTIVRAMLFGVYGGEKPWIQCEDIKFLCPVPGYDRHFTICESLGIKMINVPLNDNGPDMDMVEKLVSEDESIKGIWCVPKYSNPTGVTYSDEVVRRFARLKPKAKDFRIFWDNAYTLHDVEERTDILLNILSEAKKCGNGDIVYKFMSTSKVTYPGAGVAAMAASANNINLLKKQMGPQMIGPDKLNQLRHVRYFKTADNVRQYMKLHAEIIRPRFEVVGKTLERELSGLGIADWSTPNGGYFISLNVMEGCAKRTVELLKKVGVTMTEAGATFPYGIDPEDKNIRIAPSYPSVEELALAMEVLCVCVKLSAVEKLLLSK